MSKNADFTISYRGRDADNHRLGVRELGHSLIGVERLIAIGLVTFDTGRMPKRVQRLPLTIQASEPRRGSVEISGYLELLPGFLPFVHEIVMSKMSDVIWHWISGVLLNMGGREQESKVHLEQILDFLNKVDERRHEEIMGMQRLFDPSRNIVFPVGNSCGEMIFYTPNGKTEIDIPIADAVRSKGKLEVGDMENIRVKVDGFTYHNQQLKVIHPKEPQRFISARVVDPVFLETPNIYTQAATMQNELSVTAKTTLKDGRIHALHIMDAKTVEDIDKINKKEEE